MTAPTPTAPAAGFEYLALRGHSRATAQIVTANLLNNSTENGSVTMAPGWRLYRAQFSHAARLRLYSSTAARLADSGRVAGTDPDTATDHGLFFEFVSDPGLLDAVLSPMVDGYCPSGVTVPYALTNLSGGIQAVTVTLTYVRTE